MSKAGDTLGGAAAGAAAGSSFGPIGAGIGGVLGGLGGYFGSDDEEAKRQRALQNERDLYARYARQNYDYYAQRGAGALDFYEGQMRGNNSVSGEMLRQGLERNVAAQRSLAAGASPQNAAMAARTASIQAMRGGAGLAGQQAQAGVAERAAAAQQYASLLQGLRAQDQQVGFGTPYTAPTPPSTLDKYGPAVLAGLNTYAQMNRPGSPAPQQAPLSPGLPLAAMSDRRLKTNVRDGSDDAMKALAKLKARSFEYKDAKHGAGRRAGVMAQDLEKAGLGHAVIDTPQGKAIHGGHLATSLAAMMPMLAKRISKLEGGK